MTRNGAGCKAVLPKAHPGPMLLHQGTEALAQPEEFERNRVAAALRVIALREAIKAYLPPHNHPEVRKDISESLLENANLDRLSAVGRNTLGVLA